MVGYKSNFYWSDIGTLETYRTAQRDVLSGRRRSRCPSSDGARASGSRNKARIHPSAYGHIEGYALIGEGAEVGREASLFGTVTIGSGCRLGDGATDRQSILLPGSSVGSGAYLEDCIVDPGYDVRPGEQIRGNTLVRGAS